MDSEYRKTIGTLLSVYTDIDLFALECCAARISKAPTLDAKLELAHQVDEERVHFRIQEAWLEKIGFPFRPQIDPDRRKKLLEEFSHLDWFDFLTCLQIGIEGIGIAVVEKVASKADEGTQASLEVPIRDEKRQTSFGIRELARIVEETPPGERDALAIRMASRLEWMYRWAERCLDIPFETLWGTLGLGKDEMWATVIERANALYRQIGLEPVLPGIFIST